MVLEVVLGLIVVLPLALLLLSDMLCGVGLLCLLLGVLFLSHYYLKPLTLTWGVFHVL